MLFSDADSARLGKNPSVWNEESNLRPPDYYYFHHSAIETRVTKTIKLQSSENCSAFRPGLPKICRLTTYSSKSKTSIMAANLAKFLSCCTRYNNVGCQCGRLREVERICRHQSRITPDKRKQKGGTLHASVSVNENSWWAVIRKRTICWLFLDLLLMRNNPCLHFI